MAECVKNFPTKKFTVDFSPVLKGTPFIANVPMANNGTEYSWSQAGVKRFILRPKLGKIEFGYTTGGPYFHEIPKGSNYLMDGIDPNSTTTVYFKSTVDADVMSIEYWK